MVKKSYLSLAVFLLLAGGLRAADDKNSDNNNNIVDEIVARVNDSIITHADMEKGKQAAQEELQQRNPSDWQAKWADRQKDVLRDLIDRQLLLDKGKELGITGETETIKQLDQIRKQMGLATMEDLEKAAQQQGVSYEDFKEQTREGIVTEKVIGQEVGAKIGDHITAEDVQKYYDEHQKDMELPESVTLAEIIVSTQPPKPPTDDSNKDANAQNAQLPDDQARVAQAEAKANELLEQLHKGAKFEDLARKDSDGPTAAQGGVIGEFKRGEMDKQLEEKTFGLKAGDITGVIHIRQGFIIFKVLEHQQAGVPPLKDVDEKIRRTLYVERLAPKAREYLTKLREEAYIEIRQGFVDTGASPNEVKPVMVAANTEDETKTVAKKKKKHFLLF
jgi:peptidyl-prolyl cis-trans isomerase SurA